MARIAKILPIPVNFVQGEKSIQNALAEKNFMRHPGTTIGFPPIKTASGKYLTGLDEDADYIQKMPAGPEKDAEIAVVKERRERLEASTGIPLGPRAEYYADIYGPKFSTGEVATKVKLIDGDNIFNFANPHKEIEFWWVSQWDKLIAPNLEAYKAGKCKSTVQFYVSNPVAEAASIYNKNKETTKAISTLEKLTPKKAMSIAKLMGYPVAANDSEEIVYNYLYKGIMAGVINAGEFKGQNAVALFNSTADLSDKFRSLKELIKDALNLRVYTKSGGVIYEGKTSIALSEDDLLKELSLESKQLEYLNLQTKVADKQKMRTAIQ